MAVLSSNDGCIVARSQEVKDLGIAMGVPLFQVKDICDKHNIVLFSGNLTLYRDISSRVMRVLADEVGECDIYSIDEAFFTLPDDITHDSIQALRDVVMKKVGIPVSIGVASTKTLAKQASGMGKKGDGVYLIDAENWSTLSNEVRCGTVWGLGRQTTAQLSKMGVKTAYEFMQLTPTQIRQDFGVSTERVYHELHGEPVVSMGSNSRSIRKSMTNTGSFSKTTTDILTLESAVAKQVTNIAQNLRDKSVVCARMNVSIQTDRYGDFFMQGDSTEVILSEPTSSTSVLLKYALKAVQKMYISKVPYKKTGVTVTSLMPENYITANLFSGETSEEKGQLDSVTDSINKRFGGNMIHTAAIIQKGAVSASSLRSPSYTTSWKDIPIVRAK